MAARLRSDIEGAPIRESWLAERRKGIGASDAPVVLGVSPWKKPYELWAEKVGILDPEDISKHLCIRVGLALEAIVGEAYQDETGRKVTMWPQYQIERHAAHDWWRCTPDALVFDERHGTGLLQIKTTSAFNAAEWKDEPPLHYQVQLQHELAVTGKTWGVLACLVGNDKLVHREYQRNDAFIAAMFPKLAAFWDLVKTMVPPPVDDSPSTAKVLAKLHPEDSGETMTLPPECQELTENLIAAKERVKVEEKRITGIENQIKALMGDATYGLLPDGSRWSWKTQERKGYFVEPTAFRVLRKLN